MILVSSRFHRSPIAPPPIAGDHPPSSHAAVRTGRPRMALPTRADVLARLQRRSAVIEHHPHVLVLRCASRLGDWKRAAI
jgi:hypothetical protein